MVLDEGDGGAGGFRGSAAVADLVGADMVDGAVQVNEESGAADGDPGGGGQREGFAEEAFELGDGVEDHGSASLTKADTWTQ